MKTKYPRTYHLPMSLGATSDDRTLSVEKYIEYFRGRDVVITEKMDGENTTIYHNDFHARSLDSRYHPSRSRVSSLANSIGYRIPENSRICGENLQAVHSIPYEGLPSFFLMFSAWTDDVCLDWEETEEIAKDLGLHTVPVLYQGTFNDAVVEKLISSLDSEHQEGLVIRLSGSFPYKDFNKSVAKYVRAKHVTTDVHWMQQEMLENGY